MKLHTYVLSGRSYLDRDGFHSGADPYFTEIEEQYVPAKIADDLLEGCIQARACLINLMPESGPIARQMANMIDELNPIIEAAYGDK